jgi:transcriptional regulator with XRE-family HTH domain
MKEAAPHRRFKEARERVGLSIDDVAIRSGVESLSICDIEEIEGDLTRGYSPKEVQQLCQAVGIRPIELFANIISEPAVSAEDLIELIDAEIKSRRITLEQFEDAVGWKLSELMQSPRRLLEDISIDGLQWLCRELRIDWRRVMVGLDNDNPVIQ